TVTFEVRGNCDMCKKRIESTLKLVPGVVSANWNVETKIATVSFDSTVTNQENLQKQVAMAGHESGKFTHDPKNYNELPDCCKKPEDQKEHGKHSH
ncbi:MAG: cation transporter, partial [Bacteroidia bacterium]|nr:cation transporter [Bacteroidia bacterium]